MLTFDNWRLKLAFSIRDFSFDQLLGPSSFLFIFYLGCGPRSCYPGSGSFSCLVFLQHLQSHIRKKKALLKPDIRGTGATIANPCTSVIPARDRLLVGPTPIDLFGACVLRFRPNKTYACTTALEPDGVPRDIADWRRGKTPLIRTHGDQAVMVVSVPAAASS